MTMGGECEVEVSKENQEGGGGWALFPEPSPFSPIHSQIQTKRPSAPPLAANYNGESQNAEKANARDQKKRRGLDPDVAVKAVVKTRDPTPPPFSVGMITLIGPTTYISSLTSRLWIVETNRTSDISRRRSSYPLAHIHHHVPHRTATTRVAILRQTPRRSPFHTCQNPFHTGRLVFTNDITHLFLESPPPPLCLPLHQTLPRPISAPLGPLPANTVGPGSRFQSEKFGQADM